LEHVRIIGITGMPGAGKTTIASYVSSKFGIPTFSMGNIIREKSIELGYGLSKEGQRKVVKILREQGGKDIVAKLTLEKIEKSNSKLVIIDGIRSPSEVEFFSKHARIVILALHASPKRRFYLLKKRGREDDPKDFNEFKERDKIELELGIGSVIAVADYMIVNEYITVEELYKQFDALQERILSDFEHL
jgi:dephospho-CoA kinase